MYTHTYILTYLYTMTDFDTYLLLQRPSEGRQLLPQRLTRVLQRVHADGGACEIVTLVLVWLSLV